MPPLSRARAPTRYVGRLFKDDPEGLAELQDLNVDAKVSALLTHVTIMIAAVSILLAQSDLGSFLRLALLIELICYFVVTYQILKCLKPTERHTGRGGIAEAEIETERKRVKAEAERIFRAYRLSYAANLGLTIALGAVFLAHLGLTIRHMISAV